MPRRTRRRPTRSTPRPPTCATASRTRRSSTPTQRRTGLRAGARRSSGAAIPRCLPIGPAFRPEQHRFRERIPLLRQWRPEPTVRASRQSSTSWNTRWRAPTCACTRIRSSAKYAGDANFEQPMHTDRNHSWLPPRMEPPWWHVESFLYLTDVDEGNTPTALVRRGDSVGRSTNEIFMPDGDPRVVRSRALGDRRARLAARVPARRLPPRHRPEASGQPPLLA